LNRNLNIKKLSNKKAKWDIIIIGGGASGLGAAVDSASRGFKTLLVEKSDFAKGTSSRSTKLVHGGVRYMQNGDISLVIEALKERGILKNNAPHLVKNMSFVIPSYNWWSNPFYGIGLKIYDMMAGKLGLGKSTILSKEETLKLIPNVKKKDLIGGVIYHDGQFDDSRMAISLAITAEKNGATLLNYFEVKKLTKKNNIINGIVVKDNINNEIYEIEGKVVINATGVFSDKIMKMDSPGKKKMIKPSQGVHLVLDQKFLKSQHAILIPHTSDGRVLFAVPWNKHVILGTTDTPLNEIRDEPIALKEEIEFILKNAQNFMTEKPTKNDIKSVFAGLRPLSAESDKGNTKEISRHHKISVSESGLLNILGGKWTTYRKIAEDAINTSISIGGFNERKCITENLQIHGYEENPDWKDPLHVYGKDASLIKGLKIKNGNKSLSKKLYISPNQIIWSLKNEMAIKLEDILARRTRCLFLDAKETTRIAPKVLEIMKIFLKKDNDWEKKEFSNFMEISKNYIL
jgi:glycerol-3-phosphate dehydrogenase